MATAPMTTAPLATAASSFPGPRHDHRACMDGGLDSAVRICATNGLRFTRDRRQVLEVLLREHAAIGAYDIIERIDWGGRKRASSVVYRALDFLAASGLVHKLHSRHAFIACVHPDADHGAQFLICTRCEAVAEIADRAVERVVVSAARKAGFTVRRPVIEIDGLCPYCADAHA